MARMCVVPRKTTFRPPGTKSGVQFRTNRFVLFRILFLSKFLISVLSYDVLYEFILHTFIKRKPEKWYDIIIPLTRSVLKRSKWEGRESSGLSFILMCSIIIIIIKIVVIDITAIVTIVVIITGPGAVEIRARLLIRILNSESRY